MIIVIILIIVLFALCIHQSNKIAELQTIVKLLKKENEDLRKTEYNEKIEQNNNIIENKQSIEIIENEPEIKKQMMNEKPKDNIKQTIKIAQNDNQKNKTINEQERKNTTILATGATFIILAAIVLLTSTWHVMPNFIKTGILLLIAVVFFALSSFAKEKKLNKAAKAFYYIAMAYIPIFFISISAFGFLGKYLSISGEGKFIYFTLAGIVNSIFYYIEYKRKNMPELFYGSILIQVLTVVMFSCIFESKIQNIVFCTLLYNIEFIILTNRNKLLKNNEYVYSILPYFGLISCGVLVFNIKSIIVLFDLLFVAINFLILYFKNKKNYNFAIFNTVINIMCFYFIWKMNSSMDLVFKNMIAIPLLCVVNGCIVEINKDFFVKHTAIIQLLICMQIVFFQNLTNTSNMFVITLIQLLISIYAYIKVNNSKNLLRYPDILIFLYTVISQILLAFVLKISKYQWFVYSSVSTFILYELIDRFIVRRKELKKLNFYMSHFYIAIVVVFTLIFNLKKFTNDIFAWIILTTIYIYGIYKCKNSLEAIVFKYVSYISIGITLFVISNCIETSNNVKLFIPSIITLLFLGVDSKLKLKSDMDEIFKIALYTVSYLCISFMQGIGSIISAIVLTAVISVFDYLQKNDEVKNNIPSQIVHFIGLIIVGLISFNGKNLDPFAIKVIYLSVAIVSSMCAIIKDKKEILTITSGIYLLMTAISIQNKYFGAIIFLIWNMYNYFIIFNEANYKEGFKVAIYINLLVLYNFIIGDLNVNNFATIRLIGYLICAMAISDSIKKWIDGPIKEIVVSLINLFALTMYLNNLDGMLFTLILVALIFFSYYKKSGNLFIVIIANIIVNIFVLTRKFWFSIPWWVYLLVVGSVLIAFAVKNEANENKSIPKGIVDNIKSIKEKIDKGI